MGSRQKEAQVTLAFPWHRARAATPKFLLTIFLERRREVPNQNAMGISDVSGSDLDVCAKAKRLGYAAAKSVRLYGEEYEAVSDPFLHGAELLFA